jgi:hypothetical protein
MMQKEEEQNRSYERTSRPPSCRRERDVTLSATGACGYWPVMLDSGRTASQLDAGASGRRGRSSLGTVQSPMPNQDWLEGRASARWSGFLFALTIVDHGPALSERDWPRQIISAAFYRDWSFGGAACTLLGRLPPSDRSSSKMYTFTLTHLPLTHL